LLLILLNRTARMQPLRDENRRSGRLVALGKSPLTRSSASLQNLSASFPFHLISREHEG